MSEATLQGREHWTGKGDVRLFLWRKNAVEPRDAKGTILFVHGSSMASQPRLPDLADELVRLKVHVIVTSPDEPVIRAAQAATRTIPIVMPGSVADPLEPTFWDKKQRAPLVISLARPGGNITGLTNLASELHGKRLELLKESFPRISRMAILWPSGTATETNVERY